MSRAPDDDDEASRFRGGWSSDRDDVVAPIFTITTRSDAFSTTMNRPLSCFVCVCVCMYAYICIRIHVHLSARVRVARKYSTYTHMRVYVPAGTSAPFLHYGVYVVMLVVVFAALLLLGRCSVCSVNGSNICSSSPAVTHMTTHIWYYDVVHV